MYWYTYSILSAIGFGVVVLLLSYLSKQNIAVLTVNTWFWLLTGLLFLVLTVFKSSKELKLPVHLIKWFALLAIVALVTNILSVKALQVGPNSGIVRSVQMGQVIVATIGGIILFHESITVKSGIGILLIISGVLLLINK